MKSNMAKAVLQGEGEFVQTLLYVVLPKAVQIVIIIGLGLIISKAIRSLVRKFLLKKQTQQGKTLVSVLDSTIKYVIYFLLAFAVLEVLGVPTGSILAVAGVGSVALGFGAQSLVKDIITGIFILSEEQYGIGDYVEIQGKMGKVESVGLRTTRLRHPVTGQVYIIPNGEISVVTNLTKDYQRAVVNIEIPFEPDLDTTLALLHSTMAHYDGGEKVLSPPVVQGITEYVESAMNIRIICDCRPGDAWAVEREIRHLLKNTMEAEDIFIPYATRTIHVVQEKQSTTS